MVNTLNFVLSGVYLVVILWSSDFDGNLFVLRCRRLNFDWIPCGRPGDCTDSVVGLPGERRYQTAVLHVVLLSPGPVGEERAVLRKHLAWNFRPGWERGFEPGGMQSPWSPCFAIPCARCSCYWVKFHSSADTPAVSCTLKEEPILAPELSSVMPQVKYLGRFLL